MSSSLVMSSSYATGRKKTSIARAYVSQGSGIITVNGLDASTYFRTISSLQRIKLPLAITGLLASVNVKVFIKGGGFSSQASAICHAISRALALIGDDVKKKLGNLIRFDSRVVERKKPGLRKARKKEQFSKR